MKTILHAAILVIALFGACWPAAAQSFRGSIVGTILDSTGAPIPGAEVTVKNAGTDLERSVNTDETGNYSIPELPLGEYSITVAKAGFDTVAQSGIQVDVAAERRVDITLRPGEVKSAVEVTAAVPMVDSTQDSLGATLGASQIASLPVNGRDFTKMLYMVPGISGSPDQESDSPGSYGTMTANGARGRSNNFLIDGTDMNDGYRNDPAINEAGVFGTPATILPVDAIAELAVITDFTPEYGRNAGAVVNIVTKSGTNDLHGTVLEYFRNTDLSSRNFFNFKPQEQTGLHNNQYGGSLGGPIVKNKTFFFLDYEGQRETVGLNSTARVPTQAEIISAIASNGGQVNPVIAALLARNPWPTPNINLGLPLFDASGTPNVSVTTPASNYVQSGIFKVDHSFNDNNLLTGRFYHGQSDQSFPLGLTGAGILPGYNTVTPTWVDIASVSFVHILSPNLVNETRAGFNRFEEYFFPEDRGFNPSSIGLDTGVGAQNFGLPQINVANYSSIGANLSDPRGRTDENYQFVNNLSWKLNRHQFKFGYEFRRTTIAQYFNAGYRGKLSFNSLQDFINGDPTGGGRQAEGDSNRNTYQNSHGIYFQDSYRVSREFTINYGLRWDYYGVIGEQNNLFSNYNAVDGLRQTGSPTLKQLYQPDWNNVAPRFSFAYDVGGKGKTVIRSGWGLFYDAYQQDLFLGQLPYNTFNPGPAYNGIGPKPILFSFSPSPIVAGTPVFPQSTFGATDIFAVDQHIRTPYMENYNFNIQQQIGANTVLQVGYVGSVGRKLFRYRDINQPVDPAVSASPINPRYGYINLLETSADSNYNSMQVTLRTTNFHSLTSTVNYTWAHSIDNASDGQDYVPNASQPDNSWCTACERGNSNFDVRDRITWLLDYPLPKTALTGFAGAVVNGWEISSVTTYQTGQPFTLTIYDNHNGSGEYFERPDVVGNPYAGTSTPDNFINTSAFAVPCTLNGSGGTGASACIPGTQHFGNLGRNALTGPGYFNLDMSLAKNFRLTEKASLQFRAEAYNLPNHPNFASPLLPNFGAILSSFDPNTGHAMGAFPLTVTGDVGVGNPFLGGGGPRNLQLALKLSF